MGLVCGVVMLGVAKTAVLAIPAGLHQPAWTCSQAKQVQNSGWSPVFDLNTQTHTETLFRLKLMWLLLLHPSGRLMNRHG